MTQGASPSHGCSDAATNLEKVRQTMKEAAEKSGRALGDISLVAVSKTHEASQIRPVLVLGQRIFGENRVQEAKEKWPSLREEFPDVRLHLIGPLQTNKIRDAVALFDVIETIDREKLAAGIAREIEKTGKKITCYLQVNTGSEPQKAGVLPEDADNMIALCRDQYALNIEGLMCIPPVGEEPSLHFALLREIAKRNGLEKLSMGMSKDYDTAIEFGATCVRVGSAVFGERKTRPGA